MNDLKKNFFYNVAYQVLILILPLITTPYISRVLGADGIGIYSYTYSIAYTFALVMLLGINNYGNRTIAQYREDKEQVSKKFWEIYCIQFIMSAIVIIIYALYITFFEKEYKMIGYIQIIYLLGTAIDINWFFFGMEKFKLTVMRSAIVKILSFICILVFVKTKNDVYIYTFIMTCSVLFSNIFLLFNLRKYVKKVTLTWKEILAHVKPIFILFIPVIAFSVYRIMDKIMLGSISGVTQVGFYENAEKIINIPLGIITAAGTVLLPRMSNMIAKGNDISEYLGKALKFILFISIPIAVGLIAISNTFVPLFLGKEFYESANLIKILAPAIIIMAWANMIKTIYLIPNEKDKEYTIALIIGAIVNLILNAILIPKINAYGAAIGTICAELSAAVYQTYFAKKNIKLYKLLKDTIKFMISAMIMFIVIINISKFIKNEMYSLILQILIGSILYFSINIRYINELINIREIVLKVKKKIQKSN